MKDSLVLIYGMKWLFQKIEDEFKTVIFINFITKILKILWITREKISYAMSDFTKNPGGFKQSDTQKHVQKITKRLGQGRKKMSTGTGYGRGGGLDLSQKNFFLSITLCDPDQIGFDFFCDVLDGGKQYSGIKTTFKTKNMEIKKMHI